MTSECTAQPTKKIAVVTRNAKLTRICRQIMKTSVQSYTPTRLKPFSQRQRSSVLSLGKLLTLEIVISCREAVWIMVSNDGVELDPVTANLAEGPKVVGR